MTEHQDQPASPGGAADVEDDVSLHTHPLPMWVRAAAFVYSVLLVLFGASVLYLVVTAEQHDQEERTAIYAELDRRTAERKAQEAQVQRQLDAAQAEADRRGEVTRRALCDFLSEDLEPSKNVQALTAQFRCTPIPNQ